MLITFSQYKGSNLGSSLGVRLFTKVNNGGAVLQPHTCNSTKLYYNQYFMIRWSTHFNNNLLYLLPAQLATQFLIMSTQVAAILQQQNPGSKNIQNHRTSQFISHLDQFPVNFRSSSLLAHSVVV